MPPKGRRQGGGSKATPPSPASRVQDLVPSLRSLAESMAGLRQGADAPDADEPQRIADALSDLNGQLGQGGTAAERAKGLVLRDQGLLSVLLQLVAAGCWYSVTESWAVLAAVDPSSKSAWPDAYRYLCAAHACKTLRRIVEDPPAALQGGVLDVAACLLRMGVLHAGARQLAEAAAALRAPPGPALPEDDLAAYPLDTLGDVFAALVRAATNDCGAALGERQAALLLQLADALRTSHFLEHLAQLTVLLAGRLEATNMRGFTDRFQRAIVSVQKLMGSTGADSPVHLAAASLRQALHPPAVVALLAATATAALHAADGGPAYGLDVQLYGRLRPGDGCSTLGMLQPLSDCLTYALDALQLSPRARPVGLHGACVLALRAARLAVDVLAPQQREEGAGEGEGERGGAGAAVQRRRRALGRPAAASLAPYALKAALQHLSCRRATPASDQHWREAWALLLRFLQGFLATPVAAERTEITVPFPLLNLYFTAFAATQTVLLPPPRLPAIALSTGLLPFLERTYRGMGRNATSADTLCCMAMSAVGVPPLLPLLLYGEPRQAAALVATLRKLVVLHSGSPGTLATAGVNALTKAVVESVLPLLISLRVLVTEQAAPAGADGTGAAAVGAAGAVAAEAEAGPSEGQKQQQHGQQQQEKQEKREKQAKQEQEQLPPSPQLTLAVHELLPALMRLLLQLDGSDVAALLVGPTYSYAGRSAVLVSHVVARWVLVLLLEPELASAAGAAGHSAAGGPAGGGAAAAVRLGLGWCTEVLRRLGPVAVAGACLRVFAHAVKAAEGGLDLTSSLGLDAHEVAMGVWMATGVLAACPQEVREAAVRAAEGGGLAHEDPRRWPLVQLSAYLEAQGEADAAQAARAMLGQLQRLGAGSASVGEEAVDPASLPSGLCTLFTPVPQALALLRTCSNPACVVLAGDSEADAKLLSCARCVGAWYCCKECQQAHWRAGHKEACAGGRKQ